MFENELAEWDAAGTLAAAEANEHALITAETRRLQIAAHWADPHPGEAVAESRLPGTEHPCGWVGRAPRPSGIAAAELRCALRSSDGSAARLIGDALDLRHRLPLIWAAALAGQVPAYQARQIAAATRHLSCEQAALVDQQIAPSLGAVSRGRLQTLLEAAIYQADPIGAEEKAAGCRGAVRAARPQRRRRSIRTVPGRVRWCMCISGPKLSPPARVSPGSRRSGRCCSAGCACCWAGIAPST